MIILIIAFERPILKNTLLDNMEFLNVQINMHLYHTHTKFLGSHVTANNPVKAKQCMSIYIKY